MDEKSHMLKISTTSKWMNFFHMDEKVKIKRKLKKLNISEKKLKLKLIMCQVQIGAG